MLLQGESPFPLPQELIENIFRNLDIGSILSLRLTCWAFYAASISIWLHFAREIHSRPENPRAEEPLEDYTPEELRHWVLRRYRAEQVWIAPSILKLHHPRRAEINIHGPVVLPGGRWFLSMNAASGDIMVVDMDSPQLEPRLLVKAVRYVEGTVLGARPRQFIVWVDPVAPRLTFRIALVRGESLRMDSSTFANILSQFCNLLQQFDLKVRGHIFQGQLLGHGSGATLVAEPFRQVRGFFPGCTALGVMNGRYLVQVEEVLEGGSVNFNLHVFNCEKDFSTRVRLRGFGLPLVVDVFISSNENVIIFGMDSICIYLIPTSAGTLGTEWHPIHSISTRWVSPFGQRSVPYIGKTSITIIYVRGDDLIALEIPLNINEKESLTPIAAIPGHYKWWRVVGIFDALDYRSEMNSGRCFLSLLRYPWDPHSSGEGPRGDRVFHHEVEIPSDTFPSPLHNDASATAHSFHWDIGRLVLTSSAQNLLYVYDLIPTKGSRVMDGSQVEVV